MHAIDEALRDKILNLLAAFCFELKLSRTNDEGFYALEFHSARSWWLPALSRTRFVLSSSFFLVRVVCVECWSATEWFKKHIR
nr:hypothetical protein [uncultured Campylobacter sp.]